jgi:hypothetical protein
MSRLSLSRRLSQAASLAVFAGLGFFALAPASGCSSTNNGTTGGGEDAGEMGLNSDGSAGGSSGAGCTTSTFTGCSSGGGATGDDSGITGWSMSCNSGGVGFQCVQQSCPNNGTTSLKGVVYDPAGNLPLFNVAVYVPNAPPADLPEGVACGNCQTWYTQPLVATTTDEGGNFELKNMPVGADVPLIIQVGKWRRMYTLSNVKACTSNDASALTGGGKLTLPKNHSEGHIPNIAISTGALDSLECLIRRVGIDASEYTGNPMTSADGPRIHIFTGGNSPAGMGGAQTQNPASKQSYQYLWNNDTNINQFDVILLGCEGDPTAYLNDAAQSVMMDYVNNGGRVFASHYHYAWFTTGPFSMTSAPLAQWSPDGVPGKSLTVGPDGDNGFVLADVQTALTKGGAAFPEGKSLQTWLTNVQALQNGKLPIWYARHNADLNSMNTPSQEWIYLDPSVTDAPNAAEYFSFDTPIGTAAAEQCGRVVFSDLHVSGGIDAENEPNVPPDYPGLPITPDGCADHPLTAQEKALEFMLFDLSSCLTPVNVPPQSIQPK